MLKLTLITLFLIVTATAIRVRTYDSDEPNFLDKILRSMGHSKTDDSDSENPFELLEAKYSRNGVLSSSAIQKMNPFRDLDLYDSPRPAASIDFGKKNRIKLKQDPNYCDIVDFANIKNNENWLYHQYVINDYPFRKVRDFFYETYEEPTDFSIGLPKQELSHKASLFFLIKGNFSFFKKMGVNNICYTQAYSVVNGLKSLASKKGFATHFFDYTERYKNKPKCITSESFYPTTYLLDNKEQCKTFFKILASQEFQDKKQVQPLQYLIKISVGVDMGKGVFLLTQTYEDDLKEKYENGQLCGFNKEKLLAQRYIHNPLLLDHKHKFDFRIHVLIASTNPVIVYYHDGLVRVSLQDYDLKSQDLKNHLTNVHVSQSIVQEETDLVKKQELLNYQVQSLKQFQDYLMKERYITDPDWIANYLRPKFMKAIAHITKMTMHEWSSKSGLFRLLGADFMIDEDLNVWFIEINSGPLLFRTRDDVWETTQHVIRDIIEIEFGLLRSRMTRVSKFMKKYVKSCMLTKTNCDKEAWREEFFEANRDRIDPEFAISPQNGWRLVADLNKKGKDAFMGLLDDTCFE